LMIDYRFTRTLGFESVLEKPDGKQKRDENDRFDHTYLEEQKHKLKMTAHPDAEIKIIYEACRVTAGVKWPKQLGTRSEAAGQNVDQGMRRHSCPKHEGCSLPVSSECNRNNHRNDRRESERMSKCSMPSGPHLEHPNEEEIKVRDDCKDGRRQLKFRVVLV